MSEIGRRTRADSIIFLYLKRNFKFSHPSENTLSLASPLLEWYIPSISLDLKNLNAIIFISSDNDIPSEHNLMLETKSFFIIHMPDWESFRSREYIRLASEVNILFPILLVILMTPCSIFENRLIVIKSQSPCSSTC